jgi:hypothetical protein
VGHSFSCKRCGTALVVLADGIRAAAGQSPQSFPQDDDFGTAAPRRRARSSSAFVDFLLFRRMIVPIFIQILFWIGVVGCLVAGILGIIQGVGARFGGAELILAGLALIFLGPFVLRIYCELIIVLFRINESLRDLIDDLRRRS